MYNIGDEIFICLFDRAIKGQTIKTRIIGKECSFYIVEYSYGWTDNAGNNCWYIDNTDIVDAMQIAS